MNADLKRLVFDRLAAADLLQKNWASLILAACDGRESVDAILTNAKADAVADAKRRRP